MRQPLLFIFSLFVLQLAYAQEDTTAVGSELSMFDSLQAQHTPQTPQEPTEKPKVLNPAISFDYGKAVTTAIGLDEKFEVGASLLFFEQYHVIGELGRAVLEPENGFRNIIYRSEGSYYRVGGGYLMQLNPTSKLGLAALYGVSKFDHEGKASIESEVQPGTIRFFDENNLEARWWELMITSESRMRFNKQNPEAKINRFFALGFNLRLRFLTSYDSFDLLDVYTIPGYGKTINDPQLALNLFVKFYPFGF